ncbi:MAG TPA: hypothetical protein VKH35_06540 [Thermoanaerobaculia bacterium]|nr:hypothetical protein [Thermoanaerobaculia bacterium]
MTGFHSIATDPPWLVLVVGMVTDAAILGFGTRFGRALRLDEPWSSVVGSIAAFELFTLAVEAVAMAQVATPAVLISLWVAFCAAGCVLLITGFRRPALARLRSLAVAATAAVVVLNLLIAICPSTKGDEIYYHMIVPSRIVQDGGLLFYRQPFVAAILPQMAFQIGFAPFHALGVPDAGNVVSWFFGALLAWFAFRFVRRRTGSVRWAGLAAAVLVAGLYTTVWHVSSGAHAIGDASVTLAVVALYSIDELSAAVGTRRTAVAIGILVTAAISTKVILLPLGGAVVLIAAVRLARIAPRGDRVPVAAALLLPSILFAAPLMIWTAVHAGSPFGPLLEGITGRSPYRPSEVRDFVESYIAGPRGPILEKLRNEALNDSPLLWIAVAAFAFGGRAIPVRRSIGVGLLLVQIVVILGWNTFDARYLGGVQYALLILAAVHLRDDLRERILASRGLLSAAALLVVPWMVLQAVYAAPFLRYLGGVESRSEFCARHIAFFGDYVALDRILPRNAVLLAYPLQIESLYAPRPIYFDPADVPRNAVAYLFTYDSDARPARLDGFTVAGMVYEDRNATVAAYRAPGRPPRRGIVRVWRLGRVGDRG